MTRDEAIETAVVFIGGLPESAGNLKLMLRQLGFWIAPIEATDIMLKAAYATQPVWETLRDAYLAQENK